MTRQEFIDNVTCWSDLITFCDDEGCDYCGNVYDEDLKDEYFDEHIVDMARNADGWSDLYRELDDIPTGYDYYIYNDDGWFGADYEDFDDYKNDVLEWADDHDVWDEEDDEDYVEDYVDEEIFDGDDTDEDLEDDEQFEDGCSLGELFTSCTSTLQTIKVNAEQERRQEELEFEQLISSAI